MPPLDTPSMMSITTVFDLLIGPSDSPEEKFPLAGDRAPKIEPKIDMGKKRLVQTSQVDNMGGLVGYPHSS